MTKEEIIKEIKVFYKSHEDIDEMVNDLTDGDNYLIYWADRFTEDDYPQNLELAKALYLLEEPKKEDFRELLSLGVSIASNLKDKEWAVTLYKKAEAKVEDFSDLLSLGDSIAFNLEDKEWAITLYKKVESNPNELRSYTDLINSINYTIEDKEWVKDIINKAIDNLNDTDDFFTFVGDWDELLALAEYTSSEDMLDDKELAKGVLDKAKIYKDITPLLDSARKAKEIYGDDKWANEYCEFILQKTTELIDDGFYCDVYNFIKDDLEDEDRAQEFRDEYEDNMREDYEQYESCAELFEEEDEDE